MGVEPVLAGAPEGVEVCERSGPRGRVLILVNHADEARAVTLPEPMHDVLGGGEARGPVSLPAHGVGVYAAQGKA